MRTPFFLKSMKRVRVQLTRRPEQADIYLPTRICGARTDPSLFPMIELENVFGCVEGGWISNGNEREEQSVREVHM